MTCSLQGVIDGVGCWSSLPTENLPASWLEKLRQVGQGPRFCPDMEYLGSVVSCCVGCHSPLGPLCELAACVFEFL